MINLKKKYSPPRSTIIFNDLISEGKKIISELYDSVEFNNLNFEYVGPTKSVIFYGCMDSKQLFNKITNNRIKFSEVKKKQKDFIKKLNEVKIGKKTDEQKKVIDNLNKFYNSREETMETILKCYLMLITMQNNMKLREQDLKY